MTVRTRIWLLFCVFIAAIGLIYTSNKYISSTIYSEVTMPNISEILRTRYEYGLKSAVDIQAQNLSILLKGVTDPAEIFKIVETNTDHQRFFPDDEGYYFSYTKEGVRINVPVNKADNGKNLMHLKDPNGFELIRGIVETGRKGGFLGYVYDKPGAGVQPKLSYVRTIPGTDIVLGTGVYIDSIQKESQRIENLISNSNATYDRYLLSVVLGILVIIVAFSLYIISSINNPLQKVSAFARQIADGNLDATIHLGSGTPKEILLLNETLGSMLNTLRDKISESAQKSEEAYRNTEQTRSALEKAEQAQRQAENAKHEGMLAAAHDLEDSVTIISTASMDLSAQIAQSERGALEQAARVTETATAMEEMNNTVMEVARNAGNAADISNQTREKAEHGSSIVQHAVSSIQQVHKESLALKTDMDLLKTHAEAISQIMGVISDIADQTNLLALNAAIEAARAGETGRGFAVVASEVRKLAEKTMHATADVGTAIKSIQHSAETSMSQVDKAVAVIAEANDYARQSGEALKEIVHMADSTAAQVRAIATAAEVQSTSSEEINLSMTEVNSIATGTAKAMEAAAKAVGDLAIQAQKLTGTIDEMKRS